MPELPEVETVCRGLEPVMKSKIIDKVLLRRKNLRIPFPKNMAGRLEGRKISHLSRRAKYILIHVAADAHNEEDVLVVHLGMSGQMTIVKNGAGYKPLKHDHMVISLKGGGVVVLNDARRFGMVLLEKVSGLGGHQAFQHLGPEPLESSFTGNVLHHRLCGKKANIKTALLDQRVVAGIGNIYASEALFEAGISPLASAGDVGAKKIDALVTSIKNVLTCAIKAGGSTLKDYKQADGSLGYFQHSFAVYDREGDACPRCVKNGKKNHTIHKIVQSARATYYCPHCQK